jgi:hypothetical protein
MGEPAMSAELFAVAREASGQGADWTDAFLESLLEGLSETGFDGMSGIIVFRTVALGSERAWAFTQAFRSTLRIFGMPSTFRSLPRQAAQYGVAKSSGAPFVNLEVLDRLTYT